MNKDLEETRVTQIVDEEIIEVDLKEEFKDELFQNLKLALIDEKRLLKRFCEFSEEYTEFEYDEMGMNMEDGEEILKRANKIVDKALVTIEKKLLYIFENIQINTATQMITFDLDTQEYQYKVIVEVLENSFNLEII